MTDLEEIPVKYHAAKAYPGCLPSKNLPPNDVIPFFPYLKMLYILINNYLCCFQTLEIFYSNVRIN